MTNQSSPPCTEAMKPSLKLMTTRELHDPRTVERIQMSHGLPTMGDARDLIGAELRRRTMTNNYRDR